MSQGLAPRRGVSSGLVDAVHSTKPRAKATTIEFGSSPDPHAVLPPACVGVRIPAHPGLLPTVRSAVGAVVREIGSGTDEAADLQIAAHELASTLVEHAPPWAALDIEVRYDEEDVYVRMSTDRADLDREVQLRGGGRVVLARLANSIDVSVAGPRALLVMQRSRDRVC